MSGTYTEYAFDRDGGPEAEGNCLAVAAHAPLRRGSVNGGWVDSWVNFEEQHLAHCENNGVYYVYSNQVGTAGVVTDWTGAVVQDELHYPWGKVWTTMGTQTEERFASLHHRDPDTNLDPTHFRMYSSDEGRWLTPDPAQADIFRPQSVSRYAYADGNPENLMDLFGLGPAHSCMVMGKPGICTTATGREDPDSLNPFASAVIPLIGQESSALESGWFYVGWYGGSAALGYAFGSAAYTEVGQATAAGMETYAPGSVQASTDFTSGVVTGDTSTTWALIGALAGEADDIGNWAEGAADHVWNWLFC